MRVKKNYRKEARLSTKQAKKIMRTARAVSAIYSLAVLALFGLMLVVPLTKKITMLDSILSLPKSNIFAVVLYLYCLIMLVCIMIGVGITYTKRRKKIMRKRFAAYYGVIAALKKKKKVLKSELKSKSLGKSRKREKKRELRKVKRELYLSKRALRMAKGKRKNRIETNETYKDIIRENIREMYIFENLFKTVLYVVVLGVFALAVFAYDKHFELLSVVHVAAGLLFYFIAGITKGNVTEVRWDNNAAYYHYLSGRNDYGNLELLVGKTRTYKHDASDAVLEIPEREFPLTLFVFRSMFQVLFTCCMSVLFVFYLNKLGSYYEKIDETFKLIFNIAGYVMFAALAFMWLHALDLYEFEYDCMNESIQKMRYVYRTFAIVAAVLGVAFIILPIIVETSLTVILCGAGFFILGISAFMVDVALRAKDRENLEDDFFSLDEAEAQGRVELL